MHKYGRVNDNPPLVLCDINKKITFQFNSLQYMDNSIIINCNDLLNI